MVKRTKASDFEPDIDRKTKVGDFDPDIEGFIAYPLIPKGLTGLLALPGHNKSWIVAQLIADITLHKNFLGKYTTKRMKTIYIDQDSPTDIYNSRNERCFRYYGEKYTTHGVTYMSMTGFDVTRKKDREELVDIILSFRAEGYEVLIVIDSLSTVCGGTEINRPENAIRIMSYFKELRDNGADIILVHHISLKKDFSINVNEPASYVLGSTHIISALDNSIYLFRPELKNRSISYMRPISKRTTVPIDIIGIELSEDLPDKMTANLKQIDELPNAPTDNEIVCYKVFPHVKCTVWDIYKRVGGLMTQQEVRDSMLSLVREKILISYPDRTSTLTFAINPELSEVKSTYYDILMKS